MLSDVYSAASEQRLVSMDWGGLDPEFFRLSGQLKLIVLQCLYTG